MSGERSIPWRLTTIKRGANTERERGMSESVEFAWERQFNVERAFVQCPTCEGEGDLLHSIDCDGCANGEDHSETCPRCGGETVVAALIPLSLDWSDGQAVSRRVTWCALHEHDADGSDYTPGWACRDARWVDGRWDCIPSEASLVVPWPVNDKTPKPEPEGL